MPAFLAPGVGAGGHCTKRPHRAASEVNKLRPDKNSISKAAAVADQYRIPLAYITPIALVHPLLTAPYLSPVAAYTLLLERSTAWS